MSNTVPANPSVCLAPGQAVVPQPHRWSRGREGLAGGQGDKGTGALAGRSENGAVSVSPQAEGRGQSSLAAGGCHPHIKHPAEILSALQSSTALPSRNRGGQGHGVVTSCVLLAHITAVSSAASSYKHWGVQRAHPSGARLPAGHNSKVSWIPQTQCREQQV